MDYLLSAAVGFVLALAIFINVGYSLASDDIQESCLIKQEFEAEGIKFKCEMVKE